MVDIFKTIQKTSTRIEPYHSQFLGDALRESVEGERSLFDRVWALCAPAAWEPPRNAEILNELRLDGGRRIDLLIRDRDRNLVLGIEVKTSCASAEAGQLQDYLQGLLKKGCREENTAIAFLTPFNRERAERAIGDKAGLLPTVRVFEEFAHGFERARHVSWLDVADIEWDGRAIWQAHRHYVLERMACDKGLDIWLDVWRRRNRDLYAFFPKRAVDDFWSELRPLMGEERDGGVVIDLKSFANEGEGAVAEAAEILGMALTILIRADDSIAHLRRSDRFDESMRERFLKSACRALHETLFALAARFGPVWVDGTENYGLRVVNRCPGGTFSLATSDGPYRLIVGVRR